ncbi:hypothetical protein AWENTII_000789 [Aspergillus wentii]
MSPALTITPDTATAIGRSMKSWGTPLPTRKLSPHEDVHFDKALKPRAYEMAAGTDKASKVLFLNVQILDSTGAEPFKGDVYIEGAHIRYVGTVPGIEKLRLDPSVKVIQGAGRTLMSGLGDAHTHLTWNGGAIENLGNLGVEEHTLTTARSAMMYLDSGYTMCYGAASAKERLDCVVRDAINRGILPGPRYLANGKEIARRGGELAPGITAFADGPLEMREVIRNHAKIGVDQVKLSMSGEEILESRAAKDCYYTDEETAACVDEAHRQGLRVCSHARSRDSIAQCVRHGVDVIYHASYIDEKTMDELEQKKDRHIVAPGLNWLYATVYEAGPFGYSFNQAEKAGYKNELEVTIKACKEMHQRGITILPGGDYGFAWTPHGTYARDLGHFVKLLDFTPMEAIIAATAGVAKLFMEESQLGKIKPGYYADCILVDGQPLQDISVLQDHDRLNVIMINGRIHKASHRDFESTTAIDATQDEPIEHEEFSNYITYLDDQNKPHVGHLDLDRSQITPLAMLSGAPVSSLYQVIELQNAVVPMGEPFALDSVRIQPPLNDRDILAVGKNYADHAVEFNKSGYDSSDKIDQPSHPVIFTKRATSIIASGEDIYPHPEFTTTLDYEGEIGVIVGRPGFQISEEEAMDYIWGYTIINDVTARERQRDHKQFYLGKSADSFCPMGPIAVPAAHLPKKLRVQTFVNGNKRQDATTEDLIFSIPRLIKTLSEAITLRAGDIVATGTPAGVGFGQNPASFLKTGDKVEVSVTGLGRLCNVIGSPSSDNAVASRVPLETHLANLNIERTLNGTGLTNVGGKHVHVRKMGHGPEVAVFVHGLGGTGEYFTPIIKSRDFESRYTSYVYDLEGHGLTPTNIASKVTIESLADDLANIVTYTGSTKPITLISHSLGCMIAMSYAIQNPEKIDKLILMGPVAPPLPPANRTAIASRALAVRSKGLLGSGTADAVSDAGTSNATKMFQPVAYAAVRSSLLSQIPEGYAKACMALVEAEALEIEKLTMPTLVLTGDEDKTSPVASAGKLCERLPDSRFEVLPCTGHWHVYENPDGVSRAIKLFA